MGSRTQNDSKVARIRARLSPVRVLGVLCSVWVLSCSGLSSHLGAPAGLVCDRLLVPSGTLTDALAKAKPGDCVLLATGTYEGAFVLPRDVSLAGSDDATVVLKANGAEPVLRIEGGTRSVVRGLKIIAGEGIGIAIDPGPASLLGVTVTQSTRSAVTSTCTRPDCDQRGVTFKDCIFTANAVGLDVAGATVTVEGGRIADQHGGSLSSGSGVVASAGANLTLKGVTIENNENVGVLIDGPATRAMVEGCTVNGNKGRGVWIQGPVGAGAITVWGGQFTGNSLVGIGARDTSGLTIRNVTVADTQLVKVPIDLSAFENVGDGIGLFFGTRSTTLEGIVARGNLRAQVIADQCGDGVKVAGDLTGGQYKLVVQRTASPVDAPAASLDVPGRELTVKGDPIGLMP